VTEDSPNQSTAGSDVFVSYASQDTAVANSIVDSLESQGLKCWIAPRDVKPGAQYADAIVRAINEANALVLVMSGSAVASAHVAREVERAASKRKPIIPFRIDAAGLNPELEYFLSNSQWIDVPKLGMPAALKKLAEAVGQGPKASSQDATAGKHLGRANNRIAIAATAVVVALGVAVALGLYFWSSKHGAPAPSLAVITDKSIAVLPFVDMSEKKDQEYFGDGMTEEIIDLLVKVPGLKVIGRTSSFQFKGQTQDLRIIGEKLGAHYVLEGSVRKSGDRLRVTAQFINSRDGTHVWSQTYDRDLSDVLRMQDEIAASIVRALQVEVYDVGSRPALRSTEAYSLFLQGFHAINRYDQQGFEQAVSYFQRALDLDPTFANAAVGLCIAYDNLGEYFYMPAPEAFEKARRAAELALKLDPNHAIAHAMLGNIHVVYDWDWAAADREFKIALNLAPNDSIVLFFAGQQSLIVGRWDEALKLLNAALELDPLNPSWYFELYLLQLRRGRLVEAEAAIRRTLEISPAYNFAHYHLGIALLARGQLEAALAEMMKEGDERTRVGGSAFTYFALGRKAESDAALVQWQKYANELPFSSAEIYGYRGELDQAFKWLDRAYAQKSAGLPFLKGSTLLKKLEGDPRYKALLKKMNLPE
jgi:TolB-like protein/Flp pilus assembly protein TadD